MARGQKFMCCVRNPRNINVFVRVPGLEESGSRPGGSVTGVTEKLFVCQMFMCLFRPLSETPPETLPDQARKRHININFLAGWSWDAPGFVPGTNPGLSQGQIQFVPGTNRGCPWDKPRFSPYFTQWKPGLSLGQTRFVPGTNPVCPRDKPGVEGRHKKFMC